MIESFRHRRLQRLYERNDRSGIGPSIVPRVEEILSLLDAAESIEEMDIPGTAFTRWLVHSKGFGA